MRKNLTLLFSVVVVLTICAVIYSCKKSYNDPSVASESVPDDVLAAAKEWHAAQTQANKTLSNNSRKVLPPNWKQAKQRKLADGSTEILVASPELPLSSKSNAGVVRKFIFEEVKGKVTSGVIVEMFSDAKYIADNKQDLFERYKRGSLKDFSGAVIVYDVNYNYLKSFVYKNGKLIRGGTSNIRPSSKQSSASSISALTCTDWYWVFYANGVWQYEIYAFTTCDGSNEYGGGGGGLPNGGCGYSAGTPTASCAIPQDPPVIDIQDPCINEQVEWILDGGLENDIAYMINSMFNNSTIFKLNFHEQEVVTNSQTGQVVEAKTTPSTINGVYVQADVYISRSAMQFASKEYIAATVMHETIHAYLVAKQYNFDNQNHDQKVDEYFETMVQNLRGLFGDDLSVGDAEALTWSGLEKTMGYSTFQLSNPQLADHYAIQNTYYKAGVLGTPCP